MPDGHLLNGYEAAATISIAAVPIGRAFNKVAPNPARRGTLVRVMRAGMKRNSNRRPDLKPKRERQVKAQSRSSSPTAPAPGSARAGQQGAMNPTPSHGGYPEAKRAGTRREIPSCSGIQCPKLDAGDSTVGEGRALGNQLDQGLDFLRSWQHRETVSVLVRSGSNSGPLKIIQFPCLEVTPVHAH